MSNLAVLKHNDPLRAYKAVVLALDETGRIVIFPSMRTEAIPIAVEEEARCYADYSGLRQPEWPGHDPICPDLHCSCGFYGYMKKELVIYDVADCLAEVDFYGRVIEYDKGYRAQYQRLLKIYIKNTCAVRDCMALPNRDVLWGFRSASRDLAPVLVPLCSTHRPSGPIIDTAKLTAVSVASIPNQIGTELGWADIAFAPEDAARGRIQRRHLHQYLLGHQQRRARLIVAICVALVFMMASVARLLGIRNNLIVETLLMVPPVVGALLIYLKRVERIQDV